MAEVTYYVALPFVATDEGIAAGEPTECLNPIAVVMRAEALSRKEGRVGAVAFSRSGDPATGEGASHSLGDKDVRVAHRERRPARRLPSLTGWQHARTGGRRKQDSENLPSWAFLSDHITQLRLFQRLN